MTLPHAKPKALSRSHAPKGRWGLKASLLLDADGRKLRLQFPGKSFYVKTPFKGEETIYQILFERAVRGQEVSPSKVAEEFLHKNPWLKQRTVNRLMRALETAFRESNDAQLRALRFKRPPRLGNHPVKNRGGAKAKFTPEQRKALVETISGLYGHGLKPTYEQIRKACLAMLRKQGLDDRVTLVPGTISRLKKAAGVPIKKSSPNNPNR